MSGRALAVDADLTAVCADGRFISLTGNGSTLVVSADSLATLRALRSRFLRDRLARGLEPRLRDARLTVVVRASRHRVAVAAPDLDASWLSRLLGIAPFRLRLGPLLAAWWRG